MKRSWLFLFFILLAAAGLFILPQPASASPAVQAVYQTPTPGTDGRIIYVVKKGETCLSISLLTGVSMDTMRKFNTLNEACTLYEGQQLLLGLGGPTEATPTPGPAPTATPLLPSPTPFFGTGKLCLRLFEDVNGDGVRQMEELVLPDGALSLTARDGKVSKTDITPIGKPVCYEELPQGEYNVTMAVPNGYNPTTQMSFSIELLAGDTAELEFGAQKSVKAAAPVNTDTVETQPPSPLLGLAGGALIVVGLALLGYLLLRSRSKIKD
ncbi:MAG TPA: LysM peptidoglycan-binding domain-containing protein [Anaerolineaceae bacterium]|nr:LysM peptidoglycan-binding domain-containing protein [Anaerolineaceae bacterium]HPN51946.1 LysM peptidoglycan-binding domain-containing protein [Anaerolineaceae bacterium]